MTAPEQRLRPPRTREPRLGDRTRCACGAAIHFAAWPVRTPRWLHERRQARCVDARPAQPLTEHCGCIMTHERGHREGCYRLEP